MELSGMNVLGHIFAGNFCTKYTLLRRGFLDVWLCLQRSAVCLTPRSCIFPQAVALQRGENTGRSENGTRRLKPKMVARGYLGARGLLRVYGGSSGKGKFSMSTDTTAGVEAKLEEYCAKVPTPLSIAEFTERGR